VVLTVKHAADVAQAEQLLRTCSPEVHVEQASRRLTAQADGLGDMTRIADAFETSGIAVDDLGLQRPSLDDVFLHLTGRRAAADDRPEEASSESSEQQTGDVAR
jgi:ABC-2 type transport system ATP-binding protein